MPSAARQKIPAELWRSNQNRLSGSSPVSLQSQDIQAHPGQYDMSEIDGLKSPGARRNVLTKSSKRFSPSNKRHGGSLTRRGSSDAINVGARTDNTSYEMSTSPDSDSGIHYSVMESSNSFALDSVEVPHPSQLPLPPREWLVHKASADACSTVKSLHSLFGCNVSAQKCA